MSRSGCFTGRDSEVVPVANWVRTVVVALLALAVCGGIIETHGRPAAAQDGVREAVRGTLRAGEAAAGGVTLPVHDPGGTFVGEAERAATQFAVRGGQERSVLFPLVGALAAPLFPIGHAAQILVDGLRSGLLIALFSLGLSLLLRTTGVLNIAHVEIGAFGAVGAFLLNTGTLGVRLHLVPAAGLAIAVTGLLGAFLEHGVWRRLRARSRGLLEVHVVALSLALLLHYTSLMLLLWGGDGQVSPYQQFAVQRPVVLGSLRVTPRDAVIAVIAALAVGVIVFALRHTRTGTALRALADVPDLAASSGVDTQRLQSYVWSVAAGLAALGGVLMGVSQGVGATLGFRPFLLVVAATLLGGPAGAGGVVAGSLAVGIAVEATEGWWSGDGTTLLAAPMVLLLLWLRSRYDDGDERPL
jgi:branched-chain amino acid transport system permease protein